MFTAQEKNYLYGFTENSIKPKNIKRTMLDNCYITYEITSSIGNITITFCDSKYYGYVNYLGVAYVNNKKLKTKTIAPEEILDFFNYNYHFTTVLEELRKL